METLRYDYKPKAWVMALSGLFFAGCGVVLTKVALGNDRGLIINGIIRLETRDATTFYWVLTAACVAFVVFALVGVVRGMGAPGQVVLDRTAISAPKGALNGEVVTVPLLSITDVRIMEVKSQKMLIILHPGGKLTIQRSMLPTREDFEEVVEQLAARHRALRGH